MSIHNVYEAIVRQVDSCIQVPFDIVESGTYMYPFYGIRYFFKTPDLWPLYLTVFIPQMIITIFVYLIVFIVCFPIQFIIMWIFAGPFAMLSTWISVVEQSIVISIFIVTFFILPGIQRLTFDAVLSRESDDIDWNIKLRRVVDVPFWIKCGNLVIKIPAVLAAPYMVTRAVFLLTISLIPFLGPCMVLVLQAPSKGIQSHSRYFAFKGYTYEEVKRFALENSGAYLGFGITMLLLELIPLVNVFFMFTNNLGAALWALDIEKKIKRQQDTALLPMNVIHQEVCDDLQSSLQENIQNPNPQEHVVLEGEAEADEPRDTSL